MPEKPEVQAFADSLNNYLKGEYLTEINLNSKSKYYKTKPENYTELLNLLPLKIRKIWSKGKKIIFNLSKDFYLLSSLGLEGKWTKEKGNNSGLVLKTESKKVYFDDSRRGGHFEIFKSKDALNERLAEIGPDLLNDEISEENWLKVCQSKKLAHKEVCWFLLEQKYFSGVGNYIRAEALYKAKIRPNALMGELEEEDLCNLLYYVIRVIRKSYESRGASLRSYSDFGGVRGEFTVYIYGNKKCPKDHPIIESTFSDGRTTHWCPKIQTIPSKWEGPEEMDLKKVKTGKYTVPELKEFCRQNKVAMTGNKPDLIKRLLEL